MSNWNLSYNVTEKYNVTMTPWAPIRDVLIMVNMFIIIPILTGNMLVIIAYKTTKKLQTIANIPLISLALADLLTGLVTIPMICFTYYYTYGRQTKLTCLVTFITWQVPASVSGITLLQIALMRFVAVIKPLRYKSWVTPFRTKIYCLGVWTYSLILISSFAIFEPGSICRPGKKLSFNYIITIAIHIGINSLVPAILYIYIGITIYQRKKTMTIGGDIQRNRTMSVVTISSALTTNTELQIGNGETHSNIVTKRNIWKGLKTTCDVSTVSRECEKEKDMLDANVQLEISGKINDMSRHGNSRMSEEELDRESNTINDEYSNDNDEYSNYNDEYSNDNDQNSNDNDKNSNDNDEYSNDNDENGNDNAENKQCNNVNNEQSDGYIKDSDQDSIHSNRSRRNSENTSGNMKDCLPKYDSNDSDGLNKKRENRQFTNSNELPIDGVIAFGNTGCISDGVTSMENDGIDNTNKDKVLHIHVQQADNLSCVKQEKTKDRKYSNESLDTLCTKHIYKTDKHKTTKLLVTVLACLYLCWMPYFIKIIIDIFVDFRKYHGQPYWYTVFEEVSIFVIMVNSFLNPLIYAGMDNTFRQAFHRILKRGVKIVTSRFTG